jgi:ribosomal protein S18 acetylase RimI-like enzyme
MCAIRLLCETTDEKSRLQHVLPWIKAAGDPYYDWFFQDDLTCNKFLCLWLQNPQSEIFIGRIQALFVGPLIAGGFIALDGEDLRKCRITDTKCLIAKSSLEQRRKILARLALSEGLFLPVSSDEYYLSKIAVDRGFESRGYGSLLMDMYLECGVKSGFSRYRLDVCVGNEIAIKCYEKFGFKTANESTTKNGELKYFSMTYER